MSYQVHLVNLKERINKGLVCRFRKEIKENNEENELDVISEESEYSLNYDDDSDYSLNYDADSDNDESIDELNTAFDTSINTKKFCEWIEFKLENVFEILKKIEKKKSSHNLYIIIINILITLLRCIRYYKLLTDVLMKLSYFLMLCPPWDMNLNIRKVHVLLDFLLEEVVARITSLVFIFLLTH